MQNVQISLLATTLFLAGCGGGGSSSGGSSGTPVPSGLAAIQGTWQSADCEVNGADSTTSEVVFSGSNFTQTDTFYTSNTDCSGDLSVSFHIDGTMNISGEATQAGDAEHLDLTFTRGSLTASAGTTELLTTQGISLQDFGTAEGITDINNIPVTDLVSSPQLYTIYSVTGDTLRFGLGTPSFDGSAPALRHDVLDGDVYTRVGSGPGVVVADVPDVPDVPVIGVVFDPGELRSRFDFNSGFSIVTLEGEGAYMVLQDRTVILTSTAPADFDFDAHQRESNGNVTTLEDLGFSDSDIFPPLDPGFTFDFAGSNDTTVVGSATFRSFKFTKEGEFEQSNTTVFTNVAISSSSDFAGTYSISGNSIELRFNSGEIERRLFATDGTNSVILGQQRYTTTR